MKLLNLLLPKLWCAGQMCSPTVTRFDFSCLVCRLRRRWYGKYKIPPYYIKYVYKHIDGGTFVVDAYQDRKGSIYQAENGGKLKVTRYIHVLIDPGRFLMLRCASIRVLDRIMGLLKHNKPFIEFSEFFANYPT